MHLLLGDEEPHPTLLEILRRAGVIDVIVRRDTVRHLTERDPLPLEIREVQVLSWHVYQSTRRRQRIAPSRPGTLLAQHVTERTKGERS